MPSYQFNHFTGRLRESTHFQPLYPISPTPLHTSDPPKMIYDTIKTKPVSSSNVRLSSSGGSSGGVLPAKMLKTMAEYQKNMDTPSYLLRGTPDKVLFGVTCVLTAIGVGMVFEFVARRAFPPKPQ